MSQIFCNLPKTIMSLCAYHVLIVDMFPSNLFGLVNESSKMIPGFFFFTCSAFSL